MTLKGELVCIGCSLKKLDGANAQCDLYTHHAIGFRTADGLLWSIVDNEKGHDVIRAHRLLEKGGKATITGWIYPGAHFIEIDRIEVEGVTMAQIQQAGLEEDHLIDKKEIPQVNRLAADFGARGLAVLAVNVGVNDSAGKAAAYRDKYRLDYPVAFDEGSAVTRAFGVVGTPTVLITDKNGIIRYRGSTVPEDDDYFTILEGLAGEGDPESHLLERTAAREVHRMLHELPEKYKPPLVLFYPKSGPTRKSPRGWSCRSAR